jgi:hypothetical protein
MLIASTTGRLKKASSFSRPRDDQFLKSRRFILAAVEAPKNFMQIEQQSFDPATGWKKHGGGLAGLTAQIVLAFGQRARLENPGLISELRSMYPAAHLIFCSTAGEITNIEAADGIVTATAIAMVKTRVACVVVSVRTQLESYNAGRELASRLRGQDLVHVLVVSDGQLVNGTELARGFNDTLPQGVTLTGGLAGDGEKFDRTVVGLDELPSSGQIAAVGFYGKHLAVGIGSSGGWSPFGLEHTVTSSRGNILFQLDGQNALELYKKQLGEQSAGLPASALRFPLCVTPRDCGQPVVRTILAVDEITRSLVFAGDIPEGAHVRFMRASADDLIAGAAMAAEHSRLEPAPDLAICVSCVGRRIVLGPHTTDETKSVRHVLGPKPVLTGFYSYGELAPSGFDTGCQLHNQTMTITTLRES